MTETREEPDFVPITPNPFIVGNPVRDRSMFFGREAEFDLVRRRFHPPAQGGLLVFSGDRRSGKTSILFQILDGRLGPDFLPALVDMQSMAIENDVDFLAKVASEVIDALGPERNRLAPPDFMKGSTPSIAFLEFMAELSRVFPGKTPVLLFDEYELLGNKIESGHLTVDVLHMMANLMEKHSACIVFTGSQHIEQRCQPYWRILGKSLYRVISYLQREDAINLMLKPVEKRVRYVEGTVERIFRLTAGQPFYTQAVCQNLVDHLNDSRTSTADLETIEGVVAEIVDNPFPQMIFLWDGLSRDEKISLALLASRLTGPDDYAGVSDLLAALKEGRYLLRLSEARLSTALEGLFKQDFLLKDTEARPGYAFRMDLWRLWVRRMHSVWQVMREEGMEIRRDPHRVRRRTALAAAAILVVLPLSLILLREGERSARRSEVGPAPSQATRHGAMGQNAVAAVGIPPGSAEIDLRAVPEETAILVDGVQAGAGAYRGILPVDREHSFLLRAPGYAETSLVAHPSSGATWTKVIWLRPLRGRIPSGTPAVAAAAPPAKTVLLVNTTPPRAEIRVNGAPRGLTPLVLTDLRPGRVRLSARRDGYRLADTSLELQEGSRELNLPLRPEPPGIWVAQGEEPATIYVDGALIKENIQCTGERDLAPGLHHLTFQRLTGGMLEDTLRIRSGEVIVYDFSQGRVLSRTRRGR